MNIITWLALSLLLVGSASGLRAAEQARRAAPMTAKVATHHEAGIVVAVDAAAGRLSVRDDRGTVRKFRALRARIDAVEGKTLSLADISIGDEVSIMYTASLKGRDALEVLRLHRAAKR